MDKYQRQMKRIEDRKERDSTIKKMRRQGFTLREISKKYGITIARVQQIAEEGNV